MSSGIGLQVGGKSGKPLIRSIRGLCVSSLVGTTPVGLQVGGRDGKPLIAFAPALCDDNGRLEQGKNYLGLQIGGRDGKPLVAAFCEVCDDGYSYYGSSPRYSVTCCPGITLASTINVAIHGTTNHDGTYALNAYTVDNPMISPWYPGIGAPGGGSDDVIWISDIYEDAATPVTCGTPPVLTTGTLYYVVMMTKACGVRLQQLWHIHYEPEGVDEYTVPGLGATGGTACGEATCDPFSRKLPFNSPTSPLIATSIGCLGGLPIPGDLDPNFPGSCVDGSPVGSYAEILG